jgi:hypothetical protein
LQGLSGIFEVRIYPLEYSAKAIAQAVGIDTGMYVGRDSRTLGRADIRKLNYVVSGIDQDEIRKRRKLYNRLYHEARMLIQYKRGLSFTDTLELLAHYKLIADREALVYVPAAVRCRTLVAHACAPQPEGLGRPDGGEPPRDRQGPPGPRQVDDGDAHHPPAVPARPGAQAQAGAPVRCAHTQHDAASPTLTPRPDIPAIVVESLPPSPGLPAMTRDITSPQMGAGFFGGDTDSPSPSPRHSLALRSPDVAQLAFALDASSPSSLRRSRRTSDISMLSADMADVVCVTSPGLRWAVADAPARPSPRHSMMLEDDPNHLLSSIQTSKWGGMYTAPCVPCQVLICFQTCWLRQLRKTKTSD